MPTISPFRIPYRTILISLSILVLLCTGNCGYGLKDTRTPIGIPIKTLAIPLIESTSSSIGFEADFTRIIREEFVSHTKIPLVPEGEASVVLISKVYEIKTEPLNYTLEQNTVQGQVTTYEVTRTRRLKITLDAKLLDKTMGKVIWQDKGMQDKATFSVGTDPLTTRHNERKALQEIARRLANRIYLKTMERF
ncbi:MAG: hypothetical protein JJE15_04215 [Desulfobacteraceae bacterium]|nr:hypothetical protein [Desulfobacteraceae bacterium]